MDKIFVNILCDDVALARTFYTGLGYTIVEEYSSELGICIQVTESFFIMSITKEHLASFLNNTRKIGNPRTDIMSTIAFSLPSREDVSAIADKAVLAGGTLFEAPKEEYGMFTARVWDPSGNLLEYGCF